MGVVFTFPDEADLGDDSLATKPHSELHGDLGDTLEAYIAALGKVTASGLSSKPTLYDPDSTVWDDGGWWQPKFTPDIGDGLTRFNLTTGTATDGHVVYELDQFNSPIFGRNTSTELFAESDDTYTFARVRLESQVPQNGDGGSSAKLVLNSELGDGLTLVTDQTHTQAVLVALGDQNEIQHVVVTGSPSGGTYTLTTAAGNIGPVHLTDDQVALQALLDGVFGAGVASVFFATDGTDWYVEWVGTSGNQPLDLPTILDNSLTGGTDPSVSFSRFQGGSTAQTDPLLDLQNSDGDSWLQVVPAGTDDWILRFHNDPTALVAYMEHEADTFRFGGYSVFSYADSGSGNYQSTTFSMSASNNPDGTGAVTGFTFAAATTDNEQGSFVYGADADAASSKLALKAFPAQSDPLLDLQDSDANSRLKVFPARAVEGKGLTRVLGPFPLTPDTNAVEAVPGQWTIAVDTPTPSGGAFQLPQLGVFIAATVGQGSGKRYWLSTGDGLIFDTTLDTMSVAVGVADPDPTAGGGVAHAAGDFYVQTNAGPPIAIWLGGAGGATDWTDVTSDSHFDGFDEGCPPYAWAIEAFLQHGETAFGRTTTWGVTGGPLPTSVVMTGTPLTQDDVTNDFPLTFQDFSLTGGTYSVTEDQAGVAPVWGAALFTPQVGEVLLDAWFDLFEEFDADTADVMIFGTWRDSSVAWRSNGSGDNDGLFGIDLTQSADVVNDSGALSIVNDGILSVSGHWNNSLGSIAHSGIPAVTVNAAEMLCVQEYQPTDHDRPTQGNANVYVMVATPAVAP